MQIVIRCDASPEIGAGHLFRCLTLADHLARDGAKILFLCGGPMSQLHNMIVAGGHRLHLINDSDPVSAKARWSDSRQKSDAKACLDALGGALCDWLLVDHYKLGQVWEQGMKEAASRTAVIDDNADREHICDLLVDQTLGRSPDLYRHLVPTDCQILTGSRYAMLRPEFSARRGDALDRRQTTTDTQRLLVNFGATDAGNMTLQSIRAVQQTSFAGTIVAVIGSTAPSLEDIAVEDTQNSDLELHVDAENMAELMSGADLAIGASGSTTWERCCLGLPSITICVADNQRTIGQAMHARSAAILIDNLRELPSTIESIMADPAARARLTAASAPLVDGLGVARIADCLLGNGQPLAPKDIGLRPARESDAMHLWLWRNDALARQMAKTHDPIIWPDHEKWYSKVLKDDRHTILIAELQGQPMAMVRFDDIDEGILLSINLNPAFHGKSLGYPTLKAGIEAFQAQSTTGPMLADIHKDNLPSQRIFSQCGFTKVSELEEGFGRYAQTREMTPGIG